METTNFSEKMTKQKIVEMNPLVLAFVGDGVHTLFIREMVVRSHSYTAGRMHKESSKYCNATNQSKVFEMLQAELSQEELDIAMRARNAKNSHTSKNSSVIEYKKATAFEAVVGYLYLVGDNLRLNYILNKSIELIDQIC